MNVTITARPIGQHDFWETVIATSPETNLPVDIGNIVKDGNGDWHAHGLVYNHREGAALDIARRHFAPEPGLNNPNITLVWKD